MTVAKSASTTSQFWDVKPMAQRSPAINHVYRGLTAGWNAPAALLKIHPRWEWSRLRPLAMLGPPMGVVGLLMSLQTNIREHSAQSIVRRAA